MTVNKTVYYFGYGANMSKEYLENRRRVFPSEIHTGVLKDYKLIMNMEGPNFIEPSFANIIKKPNESLEGVLSKITQNELNQIINSEGANYEVEDITVITGNKKIKAKTLIYKSNNLLSIPPSRRYMKILISAAINNQLSEGYIQKLKRHPSVYYPILSEIYAVRIFFWVRKRSKNINSN